MKITIKPYFSGSLSNFNISLIEKDLFENNNYTKLPDDLLIKHKELMARKDINDNKETLRDYWFNEKTKRLGYKAEQYLKYFSKKCLVEIYHQQIEEQK